MKGDPILRPEFELYMKMTAESSGAISKAVTAIQKQGQETLDVLKEYTIHNNHKHDETNKRIIDLAKRQDKTDEAVKANSEVTRAAKYLKWAIGIVLAGALTAYGSSLYNNISIKPINPEKQEAKKVDIQ